MLILRNYQEAAKAAVYEHLRDRDDNPCVVLPTGCHAAGHPILMFDGTVRPVEDIRVGDKLMGPDSRPRQVKRLCRGEDEMFRVVPRRGEPFIVNGDHILSLMSTNEGKRWDCSQKGGEITNIRVCDYLTKARSWKHLRKLYRVPIDFQSSAILPLPPYILGLLIGDGHIVDTVELTTADEETADAWDNYVQSTGSRTIVRDRDNRCPTYRMITGRGKYSIVTEVLENLGLAGCRSFNKFIPHIYLTANRNDRLQLLAGLIDSDGSRHRSGFEITTASRELTADIVFLCRSLGYSANCASKYSCCQTGADGWCFRIHIDGNCHEVPCRLPRKQAGRRAQKKDPLRTGFKIEACGRAQYFGFELSGDHLYVDGNFVVHHNSGKTPVIASICHDAVSLWNGRVLILAHVKELLEQATDKLRAICPEVEFGVYSAGLKRRDTKQSVIVAGIQSVYKRACELDAFDLVIVDEAHMLPPEGDGMYRQFLADARVVNPQLRVIGMTATPYRMKDGLICKADHFLNHVCYEIGVRELIRDSYLSPLITKAGKEEIDTARLHVRGGEFIAGEVEDLMDTDELVDSACAELVKYTDDRQSVLIFASGVHHGQHVARVLRETHGVECGFVCGDTPIAERDELLGRFKAGEFKFLCNVNVLTTGFDAPNVDCVALLRPTLSPGLYYQMVGRGFRLHPGKQNCLVLDFGGNVLRHGPVDAIEIEKRDDRGDGTAPAKQCPECRSVIAAGYATCPDCGYEFPPPDRKRHDEKATEAGILSDQVTNIEYEVRDITWSVHEKRDAPEDAPRTMRVDYRLGLDQWQSEFICFEHTGYARQKAVLWWKGRSPDPVPDTAKQAAELADVGALAPTEKITVRSIAGERYDRIVGYKLGEMPESSPIWNEVDLEEVPF